MQIAQTSTAIGFIAACASTFAYEIDTHANITSEAFSRSVAFTAAKSRELVLWKSRRQPLDGSGIPNFSLGLNYYDLSSSYPALRSAKIFDQLNTAVMRQGAPSAKSRWNFTGFDGQALPYFPRDWMARGAVREDDTKEVLAIRAVWWSGEQNAYDQLDASPQLNRFCNHFYDPVNNMKLDWGAPLVPCSSGDVFASAVQWAMGTTNVDGSGTPDTARKNGFSILDAREAMWTALTGTDKQGRSVALNREQRDAYWATTFRSLGDVVHLLQDLSQPQHTTD
jgi:hypothetical protein